MRISDLTTEERKAFEEYLLSTYRYDTATGKLINRKWNREYPGVIDKSNGYVRVWVYFQGEQFKLWKHRLVFFLVHRRFLRRSTISMASKPTTILKIYAK